MDRGTVISSGGGEVGLLAFVGARDIQVIKQPVVAVLSTGNELVDIHSSPPPSQATGGSAWTGVVDTNRLSLKATIQGMGYQFLDLGIAEDEYVDWCIVRSI